MMKNSDPMIKMDGNFKITVQFTLSEILDDLKKEDEDPTRFAEQSSVYVRIHSAQVIDYLKLDMNHFV
jgi:hypothetical protein